MLDHLTPSLPAGLLVPEPLERAWEWMEDQGWGRTDENGYFLTPYEPDSQLGVVFASDASLDGWFNDDSPAPERLVPLGEIAPDGSLACLWLDEGDRERFVGLTSEGDAFLIADTGVDFLRAIAIGYVELVPMFLDEPPDDEEAIAALELFREWVADEFDADVPTQWSLVPDDEFAAWVERQG